jgi:hypothetical protein
MTGRSSGARAALSGAMLLLIAATSVASAGDVPALVAPLLAARERGSLGGVEGKVYSEGRPGGEAMPYASVSVLLLPSSAEFEAELEAIKAHSRDSPDAYLEAEPKLSAARLAFQRALIDAGAGHLIFGQSSDGVGAFRFQRVPEGAWMLLAWRETPHAKRPPGLKRSEAERYKGRPQVFGQTTVVYWWKPVTVKAGEEAAVRLHDRNEWLTGVREDRRVPDTDQPATPRTRQGAAPR